MDEQPFDGFAADSTESEQSEAKDVETESTEVEAEEAEAEDTEQPEDETEEGSDEESEEEPDAEPEPALFELTLDDGTVLNVPESARDAFMKNADYTQKTQDLSEQRKELEANQERFQQAIQLQTKFTEADSAVRVIDHQIAQYQGIDWHAWAAQDPGSAQQAQAELGALREQRVQAQQELNRLHSEAQKAESTEITRQGEENRKKLPAVIPNWSPDTEKAVYEFGLKKGLTERQLASTNYDPVMLSILNDARLFGELQQKQTAKPKPKPVPKAEKVKAKKSPPKTSPEDSDSVDAWLKKRNAQIAKKAAAS